MYLRTLKPLEFVKTSTRLQRPIGNRQSRNVAEIPRVPRYQSAPVLNDYCRNSQVVVLDSELQTFEKLKSADGRFGEGEDMEPSAQSNGVDKPFVGPRKLLSVLRAPHERIPAGQFFFDGDCRCCQFVRRTQRNAATNPLVTFFV